MFDSEGFVARCKQALSASDPPSAVAALVTEALGQSKALSETFNAPDAPMVQFLYCSGELTVAHVRTAGGAVSPIHNHRMWGVIGVYAGQEDNHIYRRQGARLTRHELKSLRAGDVFVMDPELIHAIENPLEEPNGTLHVYGGDLKNRPGRSLWDPSTNEETPYSMDKLVHLTEQLNRQRSHRAP